jgi:hypothetical protein
VLLNNQDIPILIKERIKVLDHGAIEGNGAVELHPARFITWVEFIFSGRKWVHLNCLTNASLQDPSTGRTLAELSQVKATKKYMRTLEETILGRRDNGFKVLVTGGFHYRYYNNPKFKMWHHSPQLTFRRSAMNFTADGGDYVGYSRGWARDGLCTIPTSKTGAGHNWLVVTLRRQLDASSTKMITGSNYRKVQP